MDKELKGRLKNKMEFENILKLIESVSKSSLSSFTLEEGDTRITLEANRGGGSPVVTTTVNNHTIEASERQSAKSSEAPSLIVDTNDIFTGNIIKSPLVGVFYNAPSPDAAEFVKVGDKVKVGQTLGIVEAMKLMNEIESEYDGIVKKILINNEEIVEYGQPLFVIE